MDLSDIIDRHAAFTPDKAALRYDGQTLTYAQFSGRIAAAARALKSAIGLGRGDRLAILALNHPDTLVLLYACARLGAMLVPLNWRLAPAEQVFILADASVKAIVLQQSFEDVVVPMAAALPQTRVIGLDYSPPASCSLDALIGSASGDGRPPHVDISHPLLIVYTSGTTGRPKGAVLRQEALLWNAAMSHHMHDMTSADHILTVLPMFHVGGLNIQTTPALQIGATATIHARFAPGAMLDTIATDRPTISVLVPATMQAVVEHPKWSTTDLSSLRVLNTGSTQVPQAMIDAFVARGIPVVQTYGSTETSPIAVYSTVAGDWRRPGSTGLPGLYCEARIVDEHMNEVAHGTSGEIAVRGPNVFSEYWGNADATAETLRDGWYLSGDIGTRDADGYFYVHDRKKNMIISGGENIYPAEIERVLLSHPAIAEAAVIARPDPRWQEVPVGCIVLREAHDIQPSDIEAFCLAELARYKVPREYRFLQSLPRNAMGKVQHFMLRQQLACG